MPEYAVVLQLGY